MMLVLSLSTVLRCKCYSAFNDFFVVTYQRITLEA